MIDFTPKKLPKQARSRASFDAIIEASAQLLSGGTYEALTTNHIAQRAGVSIGTLYEFFSNKETIIAILAERRMQALVTVMQNALIPASSMRPWEGVAHILESAVATMVAERDVYHALLRQIPFVRQLPAVRASRAAMTDFTQMIRVRSADVLNLPAPEMDAWLISQMLSNAILEIAFRNTDAATRAVLTRELARLTYRMAVGRDPEAG
ncbi:MAG: TetR/AcrR family transcriptional regulator [Parvibaculum sp.]|nr:TetR/AcrR family transcriptional regulator [Parvibaculum sp.]